MKKLDIYEDNKRYSQKEDDKEVIKLEKQNAIMRKALEKYADVCSWMANPDNSVDRLTKYLWYYDEDGYTLARQVLDELDEAEVKE